MDWHGSTVRYCQDVEGMFFFIFILLTSRVASSLSHFSSLQYNISTPPPPTPGGEETEYSSYLSFRAEAPEPVWHSRRGAYC